MEIDGNPWFVAVDVCRCLGLSTYAGTTTHTSRLATDEKRLARQRDLPMLFIGTKAASFALISESGLYKIVLRADATPSATRFQDWVTRDVLPAIPQRLCRQQGRRLRELGEEKV